MKQLIFKLSLWIIACLLTATGCQPNPSASLDLTGEASITHFSIDGYDATIDQKQGIIQLYLPAGTDLSALRPRFSLSEGAECDLTSGEVVNFRMPVACRVTCGNLYKRYTIRVSEVEAKILSFSVDGQYLGVINQDARTIAVQVPLSANVGAMMITLTLSPQATSTPGNGEIIDCSQPVDIQVSNMTASATYRLTVTKSDIRYIAFVGTASDLSTLTNKEEREAAEWLLANVPSTRYVSFESIKDGSTSLADFAAVWWHGATPALPALATDGAVVAAFKTYYNQGGALLLTSFASKYLGNVQIPIDGREPNNCFGGGDPFATSAPWGISFKDHESHPLFAGLNLATGTTNVAYLIGSGFKTSNSVAQWHIGSDWGGYNTLADFRSLAGAIDLAGSDGDLNRGAVVIAEFPRRGSTGKVVAIGSGSYDWYDDGGGSNSYRENLERLTRNALNYILE